MKSKCRSFIAGILAAAALSGVIMTASATVARKTATVDYNNITITLDGEQLPLTNPDGSSVEPFAIDGVTYLPLRVVAEAMGLNVAWDQKTTTVILSTPEENRPIYITRTGSKYHFDETCNGGTYWEVPLSSAIGMGLTPCDKCAHD